MKTAVSVLLTLVLLALLVMVSGCQSSPVKVTILHTNDTRAHLDPMPRRATVVDRIRGEVGSDNVLLLDAGDELFGTPYYNLFKGEADLWFMQELGYNAMCPGNHEFDEGTGHLGEFIGSASFPVLCANFDFSNVKDMKEKPLAWTILEKGGQRYGVFGLTSEETSESSSPGKEVVINDHIAAARQAVAELKKEGINKIIALTHIGWDKDLELAAAVEGIDIIVGGHTATVPENYPAVVNEENTPTLVVQAGEFGKYLGRLNVTFNNKGVIQSWEGSELITVDDKISEQPEFAQKLAEYKEPLQAFLNTVIGKTLVALDGNKNNLRTGETNLGNMVTDAMLAKAKASGATMAMVNSGAIRVPVPAGDITLGKVMEVAPFENYLVVINVTGEQIIAALENGVSQVESLGGRFPQVTGLRFAWNATKPPGSRIISVDIKTPGGYAPLDKSASYRITITNFMYGGGDGYTAFKDGVNFSNLSFIDYEVLADYIKANSPVNPQVEGRITRLSEP